MSEIYSDIYLDLQHKTIESINLKQYDYSSRYIRFQIVQNGNPYELTSDIRAEIRIKKADGKKIVNNATIDMANQCITVEVTEQMTVIYGVFDCDITLFKQDFILSTMPFRINVEKTPIQSDDVEEIISTDEYGILEQTIYDATESAKKANDIADDLQNKLDSHHFVLTEDKDTANGVPSLDSSAKVPINEMYVATTTSKGITQLTDSVTSTSTSTSATPNSVKTVNDNLATETNRATGAEKTLTDNLNAEILRAKSAENSHVTDFDNPHKTTKNQLGLENVDNTSDIDKPVSTAQQSAIDLAYANSNAYTDQKIADLINGAPETLDTIKEVADAITESKSVEEALNAAIGTKASQAELDTHTSNNTIHITSDERTKLNDANDKKHSHDNKSVLDGITTSNITSWNSAVSQIGSHTIKSDVPEDANFNDTTYENATTEKDGLMSKEDKISIESFKKSLVTGVKGSAEDTYRYGDVNITPTDLGLGKVDNTADIEKNVKMANFTGYTDNICNQLTTRTFKGTARENGFMYMQADMDSKAVIVGINGLGETGVKYALSSNYANSSGSANNAQYLRTFSATSNSHGDEFRLICKHNVNNDNRFFLRLEGGTHEVSVAHARYANSAGTATDATKMPKAGGTFTGAIGLANGTWNSCGDDCYFGDYNVAGCMGFKSTTNIGCGIALFSSDGRMYNRVIVDSSASDLYLCANGSVFVSNGANNARNVIHASAFAQDSSRRVKENITDVSEEEAMKLLELTPVNFDYIGDESPKGCVGLIAEDVATLLPSCVTGDVNCADDDKDAIRAIGIDYSKFTPYLIKMIQMQQTQIEELKEIVNSLSKK